MRMYDLIEKKKRGQEMTETEIKEMIQQYVADEIPDYQNYNFGYLHFPDISSHSL